MKKTLTIIGIIALVAIMVVALVACVPNDPAKAKENLKKAGYAAPEDNTIIPTALRLVGVKNIDTVIVATNGDDSITLIYFSDSKSAKEAYNEVKEYFAADKDKKDFAVKQSGKVIYLGTDQAVKDVQ